MNIFKIFKPSNWGISKVYRDVINYRDWIRMLKSEELDLNSKFNKWKLKVNAFYTVYFTHDIEESESQLPNKVMHLRLMEQLAPLHRYLDEELGFAECIEPSFSRFENEEGELTLSCLVMYRFCFNHLSIKWILKKIIFWGLMIWSGLKYGWFNLIIEWIKTLM